MQNPEEDTEWNDLLRAKGIIPARKELVLTEDQLVKMAEEAANEVTTRHEKDLTDLSLEELDELEDDFGMDDERILLEYRMKRMAEFRELSKKARYGEVREISQTEFVKEVSEASKGEEGVWVLAFLYKGGIPACKLMAIHLDTIARKYPQLKIVSIIGDKCIPNYPDRNLPTLLLYGKGDLIRQQIGLHGLGGMSMTVKGFPFIL